MVTGTQLQVHADPSTQAIEPGDYRNSELRVLATGVRGDLKAMAKSAKR
jgi:hypothetical protein